MTLRWREHDVPFVPDQWQWLLTKPLHCKNCAILTAAFVNLFGPRPREGLATRTGAGVRKAARDETARNGTGSRSGLCRFACRTADMSCAARSARILRSPTTPSYSALDCLRMSSKKPAP